MKIPWWYTEIGEAEKQGLLSAFDGKHLSMGPVSAEWERRFAEMLQIPYAVLTPSGTAALTMALIAAGVRSGDEVIVPALTWIATGNAAAAIGAKVVLADCFPDSPLVNPYEIEKQITASTRAIIPVHLNGRACDMARIKKIAAKSGIVVIEDTCKAMFSKFEHQCLGTIGDAGCFSLGMISLVSIGYGGVVVTHSEEMYQQLKLIQNQGVPRQGEERYEVLSFNFKISDLLAGMGLAQLDRVEEKVKHLNAVYKIYSDGIVDSEHIRFIPVRIDQGAISLCAEVRVKERESFLEMLSQNDIDAIPFHLPLNRAPYLNNPSAFSNASAFADEGVILPCGPSQPLENIQCVVDVIRQWTEF
ncbi:MAG: DegT/DnrJ/EryC1/StrS family aminotransferase [Candidatus Hinthialibacter antarcticus]|nr:DegT/DnrJ/EryC1/StrS family aminotransferase [Candidatus Hinthialibacter antarcticus]